MAGSVNKVILVGNLGRDPEIRSMQDGNRIANLSVATSESWRDRNTGERKERTEWHRVVVFNDRLVEVIEKYLKKGAKVYLEGALQTRKWTDNSGQERYTTEVVLQRYRGELTMLDGRGGGGERPGHGRRPRRRAQGAHPGARRRDPVLADNLPSGRLLSLLMDGIAARGNRNQHRRLLHNQTMPDPGRNNDGCLRGQRPCPFLSKLNRKRTRRQNEELVRGLCSGIYKRHRRDGAPGRERKRRGKPAPRHWIILMGRRGSLPRSSRPLAAAAAQELFSPFTGGLQTTHITLILRRFLPPLEALPQAGRHCSNA